MSLSLHPSRNPIVRVYELFARPDLVARDGRFFLGVDDLWLRDFGSEQTRELIQFLRQTARSALRLCRLTLAEQQIINFAPRSIVDWFEWSTIDELANEGLLSGDCHHMLLRWQQPLEDYKHDHHWPRGADPVNDCLTVLDDLSTSDNGGLHFALEVRLDKGELIKEHLLKELTVSDEDVSWLLWRNPEGMQRAFNTFYDFLRYIGKLAGGPMVLFFYEPIEPYLGDFFKAFSLQATPDTRSHHEAMLGEQIQAVTPQLLFKYYELRTQYLYESRPAVGERFDLPPAMFLCQEGHLPAYPEHPLFGEGPMRSLLIYALMAWLAERTEQRNGGVCFTLPSSAEVPLEFSMTDVGREGASLFETEADWQASLLLLAHDIQRSAGRKGLRDLWARALESRSADRFAASRFFDTLESVRHDFIKLEQKPLQIGGRPPDLELRISFKKEATGGQVDFELHSELLKLFHEPAGSIPVGKSGAKPWVGDLSQMAEHYLTRILLRDVAAPSDGLPDVHGLESWGNELWADLIPKDLKQFYVDFRQEKDLTILIVSSDPSFPWELVKPYAKKGELTEERIDDTWWAMQFSLARWLAGCRPPASEIGFERVCCVAATSELTNAVREIGFFADIGIVPAQPQTKDELRRVLSENPYDILHFSCHGKFDSDQPDKSVVQLPDGTSLVPRDLRGARLEEMIGESRPLVFLNVCHSGQAGPTLTGLGGWAKHFIDIECGAFVGCGWEVSDPLAADFAIGFYEGFRGNKTLGQAIHSARQQIKAKAPANSTWLAYYLYGNPHCRLKE